MIGTNQTKLVHSVFDPLPWQIPVWRDKSKVLLLTGSAGGGKSRIAAEKINGFMLKYPNATGLALRKAREFATKSIVPMMIRVSAGETELVEVELDDKITRSVPNYAAYADDADYKKGELAFHYRNGGLLFIGGMKDDSQREAIRSIGQNGALDIAWMEEATAFTFQDFQELRTRMRGHAGGWRQIILTTNPDGPTHWINQKLIIGGLAAVYYSGAIHNIHNPSDYIDDLNTLEGIQYQRMVLGKWVQSEGVVYDNFSLEPGGSVNADAEYNPDWYTYYGVDDGFVQGGGPGTETYHPRVILIGQVTPIGGLNIFYEYYRTGVTSYDTTIDEIAALPYSFPELIYCDSSAAMFKGAFLHRGYHAWGATHPVQEGIKNLRRLICDGQGVRLLHIHPRCVNLIRELQSYRYADSGAAVAGEPRVLKIDDHGPDALRYLAWKLRFEV